MVKILSVVILLLASTANAYNGEWYKNLLPGITRFEVISIAGKPSASEKLKDIYNLKGDDYLDLIYDKNGILERCEKNCRSGSISNYCFLDGILNPSYTQSIKEYLNNAEFTCLPIFQPQANHGFVNSYYQPEGDNVREAVSWLYAQMPVRFQPGFDRRL